jgi:hypothetical protein
MLQCGSRVQTEQPYYSSWLSETGWESVDWINATSENEIFGKVPKFSLTKKVVRPSRKSKLNQLSSDHSDSAVRILDTELDRESKEAALNRKTILPLIFSKTIGKRSKLIEKRIHNRKTKKYMTESPHFPKICTLFSSPTRPDIQIKNKLDEMFPK